LAYGSEAWITLVIRLFIAQARREIGAWSLEIPCYLVLGAWKFLVIWCLELGISND
jgi:hypothetical protein